MPVNNTGEAVLIVGVIFSIVYAVSNDVELHWLIYVAFVLLILFALFQWKTIISEAGDLFRCREYMKLCITKTELEIEELRKKVE